MVDLHQLGGPLFEAVQSQSLFSDCKTWVDCIAKTDSQNIANAYQQALQQPDFSLADFIATHYQVAQQPALPQKTHHASLLETIEAIWPKLIRDADFKRPHSSLIPLPKPYIVPGGRFGEIYYWDSYFTALGLLETPHEHVVADMADNFVHLIEHVGHIPNGNRLYYTSRSQPPVFSCLVDLLVRHDPNKAIPRYLPALKREHEFWLRGQEDLGPENPAIERVVRMPDGSLLNRYWDPLNQPRPESYREDVALYQKTAPTARHTLYHHIRAACESGWDFSSRWYANPQDATSIQTGDLIPVCLNVYLYLLEQRLAHYHEHLQHNDAVHYQTQAHRRAKAIEQYCWTASQAFYSDYNWVRQEPSPSLTLAGAIPLFAKLCSRTQAAQIRQHLITRFLKPGGLVTSLQTTEHQWDAPIGWAPLHWLIVQGLRHYGYDDEAHLIAKRWLTTVDTVYRHTGRILEKYDVQKPLQSLNTAQAGEYQLQDGFGWTNSITVMFDKLVNLR